MAHDCFTVSLADVWFEEDGSDVYLNLNRVVTEVDLEENHLLECEGQIIETIKIGIVFCPFCGEKLGVSEQLIVPQFQYHNFSGR